MNLIFTSCTGRCGQTTLAEYFNLFGKDCFAEVEPPNLIYKQRWPFGGTVRIIQRKWIVTHEDLGRGKALLWYDNNENDKLEKLARKRLKRISNFWRKNYIELSKFFIRSYCDAIYNLRNDIGIIKLYRNPLKNAKSFVNRNKDFALDGVMPYFKKSGFKIDIHKLTKYQLYLWQWVEIDLRYQRFIEVHKIKKHYGFKTEALNDPKAVERLFEYFGIELEDRIRPVSPKNKNISQGKPDTAVTSQDIDEFNRFLEMIPIHIMEKVSHIKDYSP